MLAVSLACTTSRVAPDGGVSCDAGGCDVAACERGGCSGAEGDRDGAVRDSAIMRDSAIKGLHDGATRDGRDGSCDGGRTCSGSDGDKRCAGWADCNDPAAPYCAATGRCVQCVLDVDCSSRRCQNHACVEAAPCAGPGDCRDCRDGRVCDPYRKVCRACMADAECGTGVDDRCAAGRCVDVCVDHDDCTGAQGRCDPDRRECVECLQWTDCPERHHCQDGRCEINCVGGARTCEPFGRGVRTCNADGLGHSVSECPKGQTCLPNGDGVACQPERCAADSFVCDEAGEVLLACDARGAAHVGYVDCLARDEECREGTCRGTFCDPGTPVCVSAVHAGVCSEDGWHIHVEGSCDENLACDPESGQCRARVDCEPGTLACDGRRLGVCNEFGSGVLQGGTDCAGQGQTCIDGACTEEVCSPGTRACDDFNIIACNDHGSGYERVLSCPTGLYCRAMEASVTCELQTCEPGEPSCDGEVAGVCDDRGAALRTEGQVDCATAGQVCWQGACAESICTGTRACVDGNVHHCLAGGTQSELVQTCAVETYCLQTGSDSAGCRPDVCSSGQAACDGNVATTCNADGSGYVGARTDCTALDQACIAPMGCQPRVCTPGASVCKDNRVVRCDMHGATEYLAQSCLASVCRDATCMPIICTSGATHCEGSVAVACGADGTGYTRADCAAAGQSCLEGICTDGPQ